MNAARNMLSIGIKGYAVLITISKTIHHTCLDCSPGSKPPWKPQNTGPVLKRLLSGCILAVIINYHRGYTCRQNRFYHLAHGADFIVSRYYYQ